MKYTKVINKIQQTFCITTDSGAYVNGHTSWGGEIFYVFVPPYQRNKGIGKALLTLAYQTLVNECDCTTPSITSATTPEGQKIKHWYIKKFGGMEPSPDSPIIANIETADFTAHVHKGGSTSYTDKV